MVTTVTDVVQKTIRSDFLYFSSEQYKVLLERAADAGLHLTRRVCGITGNTWEVDGYPQEQGHHLVGIDTLPPFSGVWWKDYALFQALDADERDVSSLLLAKGAILLQIAGTKYYGGNWDAAARSWREVPRIKGAEDWKAVFLREGFSITFYPVFRPRAFTPLSKALKNLIFHR